MLIAADRGAAFAQANCHALQRRPSRPADTEDALASPAHKFPALPGEDKNRSFPTTAEYLTMNPLVLSSPEEPAQRRTLAKAARVVTWCAVILAISAPAHADAGLPMLAVFWPMSWLALFLIIPLEAAIGMYFTGFDGKLAAKISAQANLISTLLGIPLAWLMMVMLEVGASWVALVAPGLQAALEKSGIASSVAQVTIFSAWILPVGDAAAKWMIPCAAIFLCIPFCLISVWSEYLVARKILPAEDRSRALRWSWLANISSYSAIVLFLLAWLLYFGLLHP